MEFKTRVNPISAAYFLGEKCTELVKGYRISINAFPLSDDAQIRVVLKVIDYDLYEYVIDRTHWDYSLLSKEYNRILSLVQENIRSIQDIGDLPPFAKNAREVIMGLSPINHVK